MKFILSNYTTPILLRTNESSCNCSTFIENGKRYLISRNVSYSIVKDKSFLYDGKWHTKNFLYEIKDNYDLSFIKELETINGSNNCRFFGYEDIRTINWNNQNYFLCTKVHGNDDTGTMCIGEIKNCSLTNIKELKTQNRREKNWAPIENEPFNALYSQYKKINLNNLKLYSLSNDFKASGSTPVIKFNSYNLAIVHIRNKNVYQHYFVLYDCDYKIIKVSEPFSFFGNNTEFCCDMKFNNNVLEIFMSVNDGISYIFRLPETMIFEIFENKLTNSVCNNDIFEKFFEDAVKIQAWNVAAVQALAVNKKENLETAIEINHEKTTLNLQHKKEIQRVLLTKYYS